MAELESARKRQIVKVLPKKPVKKKKVNRLALVDAIEQNQSSSTEMRSIIGSSSIVLPTNNDRFTVIIKLNYP